MSFATLSDVAAPYSKHAAPYIIGLLRKSKSCDQKALCGPVHFRSCDDIFLLYPLMYGAATSDSVFAVLKVINAMVMAIELVYTAFIAQMMTDVTL